MENQNNLHFVTCYSFGSLSQIIFKEFDPVIIEMVDLSTNVHSTGRNRCIPIKEYDIFNISTVVVRSQNTHGVKPDFLRLQ